MSRKSKVSVDSSIVVAALLDGEDHHEACAQTLLRSPLFAWSHLLGESYSSLTGGWLGSRLPAAQTGRILAEAIAPRLDFVELAGSEIAGALAEAHRAGARGGAVYDYLHLVAARKVGVDIFYTLNVKHFRALARAGDPHILLPELNS